MSTDSVDLPRRRRRTEVAEDEGEEEPTELYVPLKVRKAQMYSRLSDAMNQSRQAEKPIARRPMVDHEQEPSSSEKKEVDRFAGMTLLEIRKAILKERGGEDLTEEEMRRAQEEELMRQMEMARAPLQGLKQTAGAAEVFTQRMDTGWRPPKNLRAMSEADRDKIRRKYNITVSGRDIPPPIKRFALMRLPPPILDALQAKNIVEPSPIQVQGLPVVLSGRDMIGVAFTGSGKTLVFTLPMVMFALQSELSRPLRKGEGPVGLALSPSRELAAQIRDVAVHFTTYLFNAGFPQLHTLLAIGGINMADQWKTIPRDKGVHMVVATPGRLVDLLGKGKINLDRCVYLSMDEADRLVDVTFEQNIREMLDHFKHQRQTVLFSATMPKQVLDFALSALVDPIEVNASRAGAANLDVIQEVEYVKAEAKIVYLLECLQKTAPPVLIFASNQRSVDDIHEYLLMKDVSAVAIHGGKDQSERQDAIKSFKEGKSDVLVATDVASKGLDFSEIQHVINYDMPKQIEDYIHRIGRTGRRGKTGIATSFINKDCDELFLLDLKHVLKEAQQKIPPALLRLPDKVTAPTSSSGMQGCAYCGGLGHSILECPKYRSTVQSKLKGNYAYDRIDSNM